MLPEPMATSWPCMTPDCPHMVYDPSVDRCSNCLFRMGANQKIESIKRRTSHKLETSKALIRDRAEARRALKKTRKSGKLKRAKTYISQLADQRKQERKNNLESPCSLTPDDLP